MASQAVLRALEGLSNVLYRGQRDIGQSRIAQAKLGLEESRTEYDIGRQKRLEQMQGEKWALEKPGLEAESERIKTEQAAQAEPFTRENLRATLNMDAEDWLTWGMRIEKSFKHIGVTANEMGAYEKDGQPINMGEAFGTRGPVKAMIIGESDLKRNLESMVERGGPEAEEAKKMLSDPQRMIEEYGKKINIMRTAQQYARSPAEIKFYEGKITDAQKKIDNLQKEIPTAVQKAQLGLLGYKTETAKLTREKLLKPEKQDQVWITDLQEGTKYQVRKGSEEHQAILTDIKVRKREDEKTPQDNFRRI